MVKGRALAPPTCSQFCCSFTVHTEDKSEENRRCYPWALSTSVRSLTHIKSSHRASRIVSSDSLLFTSITATKPEIEEDRTRVCFSTSGNYEQFSKKKKEHNTHLFLFQHTQRCTFTKFHINFLKVAVSSR